MFILFKSTFIFSLKGITSISTLILFLWLLGEYPQWRAQRSKSSNGETLTKESSTVTTLAKEQQQQQQHNDANNDDSDNNESKISIENLSLAHYILVTPFAALYILGRAIIDTIRFSLYYVIWSCEKSIPYIDDWLFDKVTVWIPKKYNQFEQWWVEKGQPGLVLYKDHLQQHTLPAVIDNTEIFFTKVYNICCVIQTSAQDFIAAWKRFTQRHDWHQLATDMGNIAYTVFWHPLVWTVTRSIRLGKLVYSGLRSAAISIKGDIVWICTVLAPTIYNYMVSTRLAKLVYGSSIKLAVGIQLVCLGINDYLLAPTLGRFLTSLVKSIDQLILLLQTRTIQQRLRRIYRWMAPNLVWAIFESSSLVIEMVTWAHLLFSQLLYPAYSLFMKHVVPRLAITYQAIIVRWWYELHVYPAWLKIYPYLNVPLLWAYTNVTAPMLRGLYTLVASIFNYVTQQLLVQLQVLLSKAIKFTMVYAHWVYGSVQLWLIKQAPVLSNLIQRIYELILNSCDWNGLKQDSWVMVSLLNDWISQQSNKAYFSLERSLGAWAKEQGVEDDDSLKKKNLIKMIA